MEYSVYINKIDKIARIAKNEVELTKTFINEYSDAMIDIKIAMEKKKDELRRKGIKTLIGIICTSIPFVIPELFSSLSPELLSGLFGAVTIKEELLPLIDLTCKTNKDNPYWLLWKWNNIR